MLPDPTLEAIASMTRTHLVYWMDLNELQPKEWLPGLELLPSSIREIVGTWRFFR